jgi:hypothetical protein
MKGTRFLEQSETNYVMTQCHIHEERNPQSLRRETSKTPNLGSYGKLNED